MTNNVIRSPGEGIQLSGNVISGGYYDTDGRDFTFGNNLFERIDARGDGTGWGFKFIRGVDMTQNVTIDHNTFFSTRGFLTLDTANPFHSVIGGNFIVTNNVFQYGSYGLFTSNRHCRCSGDLRAVCAKIIGLPPVVPLQLRKSG